MMKKFILATVSAIALFGIAACSDSGTDQTTTQSTNPPATTTPAPADPGTNGTMKPADPNAPAAPAQ
jgi:ABC-type oligopeptide transport system substrate-binding subunit